MQLLSLTIAAQLDPVVSILGVAAAMAVSFVVITLVSSYYRFQKIVEQAEEADPEEMGASASAVLRVQMARYLAGCARRNTSFTLALIRLPKAENPVRMGSPEMAAVKAAARRGDVACVFDERTVVLLLESEPEDGVNILTRITAALGAGFEGVRAGLSSYPGHGLSGKDLIAAAVGALETATDDEPIFMPEIEDADAEDAETLDETADVETEDFDEQDDHAPTSRGWRDRRANAMLDELTGVLKPSAISTYMQRAMSELRRHKKEAALFCIGLNNMDHIERFHGGDAAGDVMAGVSKLLQSCLRAEDLIGRHEKYAYLVLAQCSSEEAEIIGRRITTGVQQAQFQAGNKKLKTTVTLGVASFPQHGRNLHHLYLAGQRVLDHSRANDIRAYAVYDPEIHDKVDTKPMKSIKSMQA